MAGGRNDDAIAQALEVMAQALQNQQGRINHNAGENDEFRALGRFQQNDPPIFKGRHDLDGVQTWLKKIKKIFRVMDCSKEKKVQFGTHMLEEAAEDWFNNAC